MCTKYLRCHPTDSRQVQPRLMCRVATRIGVQGTRMGLLCTLAVVGIAFVLVRSAVAQVAVRADRIYTMAGPAIEDGIVIVRDGNIAQVGPVRDVEVPAGFEVLEASVVTPGLIDAHSVVGLSGIYNEEHDQDQLETSNPIQPELRAFDAYNPQEELVGWIRDLGVTTVHTGHGPGALISGQTMVVKTTGGVLRDAIVDSVAMVASSLGRVIDGRYESPGTRAKSVAMLRQAFVDAEDYARDEGAKRDLGKDILVQVLKGEVPLMVTVQRAPDIMSALRLAEEFGFDLVLDGAAESYLIVDEIREAGVPVILHPTMARATGELSNATLETAARLKEAGILVALQSGLESYVPKTRVVLFEAAIAAANGLSFEEALATVTIDAARLLGIDDRVGSIEPGKDGDLVLFDGDPFEYITHVCGVVIEGTVVSRECR